MQNIQPYRAYDRKHHRIRIIDTISFKHNHASFVLMELGILNIVDDRTLDDIELLYPSYQNDKHNQPLYSNQIVKVTSKIGEFTAKVIFEHGSFGLLPINDDLLNHYADNPNDTVLFLRDLIELNNDSDHIISNIEIIGYDYPDLKHDDIDHYHMMHE